MKFVIIIALAVICYCSNAQGPQAAAPVSAHGSIAVPSLQSLNIEVLQSTTVNFANASDLDNGIAIPNFIRASVISNVPYVLSVMCGSNGLSADGGTPMPASVIQLRNSQGQMVPLSASAKTLLVSTTNQVQSTFLIDAFIHPGWNFPGDQYKAALIFTLTPQ